MCVRFGLITITVKEHRAKVSSEKKLVNFLGKLSSSVILYDNFFSLKVMSRIFSQQTLMLLCSASFFRVDKLAFRPIWLQFAKAAKYFLSYIDYFQIGFKKWKALSRIIVWQVCSNLYLVYWRFTLLSMFFKRRNYTFCVRTSHII